MDLEKYKRFKFFDVSTIHISGAETFETCRHPRNMFIPQIVLITTLTYLLLSSCVRTTEGHIFNVSCYLETVDILDGTTLNVYRLDSETALLYNTIWHQSDSNVAWHSYKINDTQNSDCYTFEVSQFSTTSIGWSLVETAPGYTLFVNGMQLSLEFECAVKDTQSDSRAFTTTIDFCLSMFGWNNNNNTNNNNNVTFYWESYPQELTLEITKYQDSSTVLYSNNFGVPKDDNAYDLNRTFEFTNVVNGCYTITFYENNFDNLESSLTDHSLYKILLNNNIIAYGGHFAVSESHSFCTNETNYCILPYQCQGINLSSLQIALAKPNSYKSFFNISLDYSSAYSRDCNGAFSCQESESNFILNDVESQCNGAYSCYGMYNAAQIFVPPDWFCSGYQSCTSNSFYFTVRGASSVSEWNLFWYVV